MLVSSPLQFINSIQLNDETAYTNVLCNLEAQIDKLFTSKDKFFVTVAVVEALNNGFKHGRFPVTIEFSMSNNETLIKVADCGDGFDVSKKMKEISEKGVDPLLHDSIFAENGRGVLIMVKAAKNVFFNDKGNEVTLIFKNNE